MWHRECRLYCFTCGGCTKAMAMLPLLGAGFERGSWEIAPTFETGSRASAITRREIFLFAARTERPTAKGAGILVIPIVSAELQNDAAAVKTAHAAARWVGDELVKRGFDNGQVRIAEEVRAPYAKKFDVRVGAHVSALHCNTKTQTRILVCA